MKRLEGGYLGYTLGQTTKDAKGLFNIEHQFTRKKKGIWPNVLYDPLQLSPNLWLNFGDTTSVTTVSGKVSQINDLSGNNKHFTQSTAANRPTYTANAINGKSVGDWGSTTNDYWLSNATLNLTVKEIYCLVSFSTIGATFPTYNGLLGPTSTSSSYGTWLTFNQGGTGIYTSGWEIYINGNNSINRASNVFYEIKSPCILRAKITTGTASANDITLGRDRQIENRGWLGYIGELLTFSSELSSENRTQLLNYLSYNWDVTLV